MSLRGVAVLALAAVVLVGCAVADDARVEAQRATLAAFGAWVCDERPALADPDSPGVIMDREGNVLEAGAQADAIDRGFAIEPTAVIDDAGEEVDGVRVSHVPDAGVSVDVPCA